MNRIRDARKAKGLTMKELGGQIGVSESTISMYENSKREPDNATLIRIADLLDVSLDYLLCRSSLVEGTQKQLPAVGEELDDTLVSLLMDSDLSAQELQRVRDFVEGLKAARTD